MPHITTTEKRLILRSMYRVFTKTHGKRAYKITWIGKGKDITYPTGVKGWTCRVRIEAPGFKPASFKLMWDQSGYWHLLLINERNLRLQAIASRINWNNL